MSSWHNRLKRRQHKSNPLKPVILKYIFNDGSVINDFGDGEGRKKAQRRLLSAPKGKDVSYKVEMAIPGYTELARH